MNDFEPPCSHDGLFLVCSEVIDAMYAPSRYDHVYPFSYLYTYFVSVPHSILIQLASPTANKTYGQFTPVWLTFSTL